MKKTLISELKIRNSDCVVETKDNIYIGFSFDLIELIPKKELYQFVTQKCKTIAGDEFQWQLWTN